MNLDVATISILGIPVHPFTMDGAVTALDKAIINRQQAFVVTANAEIIMMAQEDGAYQKILTEIADVVLPDGAGTVWAGRHLGYTVPERVAGYDLFQRLLALAAAKGYKVYFFGGTPGIAEVAAQRSAEQYPGLQVVGTRNGYFTEQEVPEIIAEINASGAELLFVALGAPKQEIWLAEHGQKLQAAVRMGIGGSFDVVAGKMQRAPLWMQNAGLEWLFRLYKQPGRFVRMLALPKFVIKVWMSK